mmetsp:Transcript_45447/g.72923  ORF Transcript_45447/g.72923 Transcript_45447/m.72923 type:complete len:296 (+) Transcript_45447:929-1816(+)
MSVVSFHCTESTMVASLYDAALSTGVMNRSRLRSMNTNLRSGVDPVWLSRTSVTSSAWVTSSPTAFPAAVSRKRTTLDVLRSMSARVSGESAADCSVMSSGRMPANLGAQICRPSYPYSWHPPPCTRRKQVRHCSTSVTTSLTSNIHGVAQFVSLYTHTCVEVTTTKKPKPRLIFTTRSLKSRSSIDSLMMSRTFTRVPSVSVALILSHSRVWSTSEPKHTLPLPPAPANCVPSAVHAMFSTEPVSNFALLHAHPVLSHRNSALNVPTAKNSPPGFHVTAVMTWSWGADWYRSRP